MSLVWLELLQVMKGRSGVALSQFSSSSSIGYIGATRNHYLPCHKSFQLIPGTLLFVPSSAACLVEPGVPAWPCDVLGLLQAARADSRVNR